MIILLGGSGYVGTAFRELLSRKQVDHRSISRRDCDYTTVEPLAELIRDTKASFVINAAGYTRKPKCPWEKSSMAFFTLATPKKAEVFWGRRAPYPAAADFIHGLLLSMLVTAARLLVWRGMPWYQASFAKPASDLSPQWATSPAAASTSGARSEDERS